MKLLEIMRPAIRTHQMKANFDLARLNQRADAISDDASDVGMYAAVKRNNRIPHEVSKVTHMPSSLQNDGYYQYVMAIQSHMKDNPFLPRIYVIDIKRASNGATKPSYRMEKLWPHTVLDAVALHAIGMKCFSNFGDLPKILDGLSMVSSDDDKKHAVWIKICQLVYHLVINGDVGDAGDVNPQLLKAADLINAVLNKNASFHNDMHFNNFMVRLTSTGPQLVITDPIGDGGHSIVGRSLQDDDPSGLR